ncbi:MAG TPA: LysM peptidoglycan-binding domain-containing protein [Caldilineae bacterium]|nr:LysM peptidoglycan-binding domain-containing protein [Caldilineae bacterium]
MGRYRHWIGILLVIFVAFSGMAAGCTRKRPVPTPMPMDVGASSQEGAGATSEPARDAEEPKVTVAAVEGDQAQPGGPSSPSVSTPGPAQPAPTPAIETADYTVGSGETLFSIAQRLGVDVDTLRQLNGLTTDEVTPGQVIKVPAAALAGAPTPAPSPGQPIEHIVQPGEWLSAIAEKYGVSPEAIIRANNLTRPDLIYPGQKLIIPISGAGSPGRAEGGGRMPGRKIHIVQRGETLQSIALRYGVTVNEIIAANGIINPNLIYVGQKLIIP